MPPILPVHLEHRNATFLFGGDISVGDVNHDGYVDMAISGVDELGIYQTSIYKNRGDETFEQTVLNAALAKKLLIADLNKDGKADLFFSGTTQDNQNKLTIGALKNELINSIDFIVRLYSI